MNRRSFLRAAIAGAAAVPLLSLPRRAHALTSVPIGVWSGSTATTHAGPVQRVFEIFLRGGICAFDTFLVESGLAAACASTPTCQPVTDSRTNFPPSRMEALKWDTYACGFGRMYTDELAARAGMPRTTPFVDGYDWGPATWPLWPHLDRARVVTMRHSLGAHPPAVALMQTGFSPGSPRSFSSGTAINARFREGAAPVVRVGSVDIRMPAAYALSSQRDVGGYESIFDSGRLGSQYRPLQITVNKCRPTPNTDAFPPRAPLATGEEAALQFYRNDYDGRLARPLGGAVSSSVMANYDAALADYLRADQVNLALGRYDETRYALPAPMLSSADCIERGISGVVCTPEQYAARTQGDATALHMGAFLLRECGARYVHAFVGDLDTHEDHVRRSYSELSRIFQHLAALLGSGAIPSDTLVVLTTEFGRTPEAELPNGRNHFPEGYATVLLRPPGSAINFRGRSVLGRIESTGTAASATAATPAQLRAAIMVALGINPFGADGFNEGSVVGGPITGTSHLELCQSLKTNLLGFPGA